MRSFTWLCPDTTATVVKLLRDHGADAQVIAGGQSLLLAMKERTASPSYLVSLGGISALSGAAYGTDGALVVGSATTYTALTRATLSGWHRVWAEVAGNLADRPVRNRGTIGGALCAADPRFDVPALAVGVAAQLQVTGAAGDRALPAEQFVQGRGITALGPDEILTAVVVPPLPTWNVVVFDKFRQRVFDAAIVSVTCALRCGADGLPEVVRITVGGAADAPVPVSVDAAVFTSGDQAGSLAGDLVVDRIFADVDAADEATRFRGELVRSLVRRGVDRARTALASGGSV